MKSSSVKTNSLWLKGFEQVSLRLDADKIWPIGPVI